LRSELASARSFLELGLLLGVRRELATDLGRESAATLGVEPGQRITSRLLFLGEVPARPSARDLLQVVLEVLRSVSSMPSLTSRPLIAFSTVTVLVELGTLVAAQGAFEHCSASVALVSPTLCRPRSRAACNVELAGAPFSSPATIQIELALAHQSAFLEFGVVRRRAGSFRSGYSSLP